MADNQSASASAPADESADSQAAGSSTASSRTANSRAAARAERRAGRLAKQIGAFAGQHGGSTEGHLGYLGERGTRIVLVGADGTWGDLMAPSQAIAERATELAEITVHDTFDGELAGRVRTGSYEWTRMAGNQLSGVR